MTLPSARRVAGRVSRRLRRPALSVVMPCRNEVNYVEVAIRSILNQDLRNLEVIVVDDGSSDGSVEVVKRIATRDRRVRLLTTMGSQGPGLARNLGIQAARGRYLAFADADDLVLPGAYTAMSGALRHPKVDMVVGGYQRHGSSGRIRPHLVNRVHAVDRVGITAEQWPALLDEVVIWNRMFRTRFWRRHVVGFPETGNYEDREPALRSTLRARRITVLASDVYAWRLADGRQTRSQHKREVSDLADRFAVARREVALLRGAQPMVTRQVWARLLGTDLGLFAVNIPTTGGGYWEMFCNVAAWLTEHAPDDVWPQVPFWERIIVQCAAARSRVDVEELLGTRAEDGSAVPLTVEGHSRLRVSHPVVDRLVTPVGRQMLDVDASLMNAVCGVSRVQWVGETDLRIQGHAYVTGLPPDSEGLTVRIVDLQGAGRSLPYERRTDDTIDIGTGDSWCSYRESGFTVTATLPGPQPGRVEAPTLDLEIHLAWGEHVWTAQMHVSPPDCRPDQEAPAITTRQGTPLHVRVESLQVKEGAVVIIGKTDRMVDFLRVGLKTSGSEFSTCVEIDPDREFRAEISPITGLALPSDGYFVRWGRDGKPLDGWARPGARLREGPIECEGRLLRATARGHVNSTSVTVGPALTARERSRVGQRRLRHAEHLGPLERAVLLESFNGKSCGDNPGAIAKGLLHANVQVPLYWSVRDLSVQVPDGGLPLVIGSADWHRMLSTAAVLINNNNFPHWFSKREGQFYLQTWHGTPIKRLLWDLPASKVPLTYRRLMRRQVPMWDLLLAQTPEAADNLRSGLGYDGEVLVGEQPRNTALSEGERGRYRVRKQLGIDLSEPVVLYAPTWRELHRTADRATAWSESLDVEQLATETDARVLVRSHHVSRRAPMVSDRVLDVSTYPSVEGLMLAADVLVSDYSSILHDWQLLERPAVLFTPDLEHYRDEERGFYGDWPPSGPWPSVRREAELHGVVRHLLEDVTSQTGRSAARFVDGCQRVVDSIVEILAKPGSPTS